MKIFKNILLSILFSITFFVVSFSLTVLNKHFIYKVMDKTDYYDTVYNDIEIEMKDVNHVVFKDKVIKDIKTYVKYRYDNTFFTNKIVTSDRTDKYREVYNYHVRFKNVFLKYDISIISSFIYLLCFVLLGITGFIFIKTKRKHNILFVFIFNLCVSIISGLLIYNNLRFNEDIFNSVKSYFVIYYIIFSIFILIGYYLGKNKKRLLIK